MLTSWQFLLMHRLWPWGFTHFSTNWPLHNVWSRNSRAFTFHKYALVVTKTFYSVQWFLTIDFCRNFELTWSLKCLLFKTFHDCIPKAVDDNSLKLLVESNDTTMCIFIHAIKLSALIVMTRASTSIAKCAEGILHNNISNLFKRLLCAKSKAV